MPDSDAIPRLVYYEVVCKLCLFRVTIVGGAGATFMQCPGCKKGGGWMVRAYAVALTAEES